MSDPREAGTANVPRRAASASFTRAVRWPCLPTPRGSSYQWAYICQ